MVEAVPAQNQFNSQINEQVRKILDVFDRARENLDSNTLRDVVVPTIVVIGDQSHGKSSVMENIAGINLLKGSGCVTKCPLEIKLRSRDPNGTKAHDYATIHHKRMAEGELVEIDDLNQIEHEIKRIQDEITNADNKLIVDVPIYLTIYRENQFDLTMIDLPGMTY